MTLKEIILFRLRSITKLLISAIEMFIALAIAQGS